MDDDPLIIYSSPGETVDPLIVAALGARQPSHRSDSVVAVGEGCWVDWKGAGGGSGSASYRGIDWGLYNSRQTGGSSDKKQGTSCPDCGFYVTWSKVILALESR